MDAYGTEVERVMKRLFDSLAEKDRRRYAAVEATKLATVELSTSPVSSAATPRQSAKGRRSWRTRTTWTPVASEKRGWTETADRHRAGPSRELPEGYREPHRR